VFQRLTLSSSTLDDDVPKAHEREGWMDRRGGKKEKVNVRMAE